MTDGERERRQRFDAVFTSCSSDIVAYCGWRAASASDAQDAAAEVFLIAWRRLDELPEGDAARVWLYATARRVIANQRRSTRRQAELYERLALHDPSWVQEPPSSDLEEALVHEAIRRLGPRDRDASGPAGAGWVVLGNEGGFKADLLDRRWRLNGRQVSTRCFRCVGASAGSSCAAMASQEGSSISFS